MLRLRYVLLIDPVTKLVEQSESYKLIDGRYVLRTRRKFLEYNDSIDPTIFDLEPPEGAEILDLTHDIGLPQGNLSDAEVASEVVRQYLEAKIYEDYEKASKLYNRMTVDKLRKRGERIKVVRVVFIGEPKLQVDRGPRVYWVPFAYEIETPDGKRKIAGPPVESGRYREAEVRPVVGQPDHWVIAGGI